MSDSFSIQMDHTGTPRARGTRNTVDSSPYFEPGPVAEGAGDAGGASAAPPAADPTKVFQFARDCA